MTKMTETQFRKRMASLVIPEGFTGTFKSATWGHGEHEETYWKYVLTNHKDKELVFDSWGSGHTRYFVAEKDYWASFDRTGVEDSFYHIDWNGKKEDLNDLVKEQFERIAQRLDYHKTAVAVPGIPFTLSPAGVEDLKNRLFKQGSISFMPSGFGTGYTLTTKKYRGVLRAKPETEAFFGKAPLYLSTFDAD